MRGIRYYIITGICAIAGLVGRQARAQVLAPEDIPFTQDIALLKAKAQQLCAIQLVADKSTYRVYSLAVKRGKTWQHDFPLIYLAKQDLGSPIEIKDIEFVGKRIYIAGNFKLYNSNKNCLIYLDRTSTSNPWKGDFEFSKSPQTCVVNTITLAGDYLYVGGTFNKISQSTGSFECPNLARIALKNFVLQRVLLNKNNGTDSTVNSIEYDTTSKYLLVGGLFRKIVGQSIKALAKLNPADTSQVSELTSAKALSSIYKMRFFGGKIYTFAFHQDSGIGVYIIGGTLVKVKGIQSINTVTNFFPNNAQLFLYGTIKLTGAQLNSQGLFLFSENNGATEVLRKFYVVNAAEGYNNDIYLAGNFKSVQFEQTLGRVVPEFQRFVGRVFADLDNNGTFSNGDKAIPNRTIRIKTNAGSNLIESGPGGYFTFTYPQIPSVFKVLIENQGDLKSGFEFLFKGDTIKERLFEFPLKFIKNNYSDLTVRMTAATGWLTRNDTSEIYILTVTNKGLLDVNVPSLNLNFDKVQDIKTFPAHTITNANSISWSNQAIPSGGEQSYMIKLTVPSKNYAAGQTVQFNTTMPGLIDDNPTNNTDTLQQTVTKGINAFLKSQNPAPVGSDSFAWLAPTSGKVDYTIRFSNFGTDTVNTVVVKDTISTPDYVTYIQETGASNSFTRQVYTTPTLPDKVIVVYTFPNIKLPPNPSGNTEISSASGFIAFRVGFSPAQIPAGASIRNRASVYMDVDEPVMTNTVVAKTPTSSIHQFHTSQKTVVYPNPCTDKIMFVNEVIGARIMLYSLDGKLLLSEKIGTAAMDIQKLNLSPGSYMYCISAENKSIFTGILIKN